MIRFTAAIRKQVISLGPQVLILDSLSMNILNIALVQGLNNLGRDTCYQRERWYLGTLGNYGAGGNNAAMADNSAIQNCRTHANQAMIFHGAGMQSGRMTYRYIIAHDASKLVCHVQAAVVLNIAVLANFDTVYIAAHSNIEPAAAVFLHRHFADNGSRFKHMRLSIN